VAVVFYQIELIADPYSDQRSQATYRHEPKELHQVQKKHQHGRATQNCNVCSSGKIHRPPL